MKLKFTIFLVAIFFANLSSAQDFKGHVSTSFGIINPKWRVQIEFPVNDRASMGIAANYYFINWSGPTLEPFFRLYSRSGNDSGFFGQAKLIYGNLSTLDFDLYEGALENKRWSTFGIGFSAGYKFLLGDHFTIEPLAGFRFLSPPVYRYKTGYDEDFYTGIGEGIGWYLTTGFPMDIQIKFGYQF